MTRRRRDMIGKLSVKSLLLLLRLATCGPCLRTLAAVLRAAAAATLNSERVERAADDMITDTRQILHAPAAHEHDRVLLQIVTLARNVSDHLIAIRQAHLRHFAQRRVRLLRRTRHHLQAHAAAERTVLERRRLGLVFDLRASFADELVDSW